MTRVNCHTLVRHPKVGSMSARLIYMRCFLAGFCVDQSHCLPTLLCAELSLLYVYLRFVRSADETLLSEDMTVVLEVVT